MKKSILISALLLALATISASSQPSHSIKNIFTIPDFYSVVLNGGNLNVELIHSETNEIEVELHNSELEKFRWTVSDGVLSVTLRPTVGAKPSADVKIYYNGNLHEISASGTQLTADEPVTSHIMILKVSGGARVNMAVDARDLEVEVTGNSSLMLSGTAKYLTLRATERSMVDTRKLDVVSAEVEAATSAEIYVNATERLVANARTTAKIFYMGNPIIFKDRSSRLNTTMGSSVYNIGPKESVRY